MELANFSITPVSLYSDDLLGMMLTDDTRRGSTVVLRGIW